VIIKNPGRRPTKLDMNTSSGRFLGYIATDKNVYYLDNQTHHLKLATHCIFDEARMTLPPADHTPAIEALQQASWPSIQQEPEPAQTEKTTTPILPSDELLIQRLSPQAKIPERATDGLAGYDLYSATEILIPPGKRVCIPLDIAIHPPTGTYAQIAPRSSMAVRHHIGVKAGVIDSDCTGNVTVVLQNNGSQPYQVQLGDRIAQMILQIHTPTASEVTTLQPTQRGQNRFGSAGQLTIHQTHTKTNQVQNPPAHPKVNPTLHPQAHPEADPTQYPQAHPESDPAQHPPAYQETDTPDHPSTGPPNTSMRDPHKNSEDTPNDLTELPFNIYLSQDPFDQLLPIDLPIKGDNETLGLKIVMCPYRHRLRLVEMALSTPASRIPRWRSTLQNAYLISVQGTPIFDEDTVIQLISTARQQGQFKLSLVFSTDNSYGVHPQEGIQQLYFDQLNVIAQHLQQPTIHTLQSTDSIQTESTQPP